MQAIILKWSWIGPGYVAPIAYHPATNNGLRIQLFGARIGNEMTFTFAFPILADWK